MKECEGLRWSPTYEDLWQYICAVKINITREENRDKRLDDIKQTVLGLLSWQSIVLHPLTARSNLPSRLPGSEFAADRRSADPASPSHRRVAAAKETDEATRQRAGKNHGISRKARSQVFRVTRHSALWKILF